MKRPKLERTDLAIVIIALLYILSPFDLVPEIVAGPLGLTDDLAAAGVLAVTLLRARRSRNDAVIPGSVVDPDSRDDAQA
jgi:uncharacterized membrane protein YkvA (DUF1232 family)